MAPLREAKDQRRDRDFHAHPHPFDGGPHDTPCLGGWGMQRGQARARCDEEEREREDGVGDEMWVYCER